MSKPMAKKTQHGPNKAKSLIAQPLFRCRQEKPHKGKGSYRREATQQNWEASCFVAACKPRHSPHRASFVLR
jgi:alternative ribosome-rescue factor